MIGLRKEDLSVRSRIALIKVVATGLTIVFKIGPIFAWSLQIMVFSL